MAFVDFLRLLALFVGRMLLAMSFAYRSLDLIYSDEFIDDRPHLVYSTKLSYYVWAVGMLQAISAYLLPFVVFPDALPLAFLVGVLTTMALAESPLQWLDPMSPAFPQQTLLLGSALSLLPQYWVNGHEVLSTIALGRWMPFTASDRWSRFETLRLTSSGCSLQRCELWHPWPSRLPAIWRGTRSTTEARAYAPLGLLNGWDTVGCTGHLCDSLVRRTPRRPGPARAGATSSRISQPTATASEERQAQEVGELRHRLEEEMQKSAELTKDKAQLRRELAAAEERQAQEVGELRHRLEDEKQKLSEATEGRAQLELDLTEAEQLQRRHVADLLQNLEKEKQIVMDLVQSKSAIEQDLCAALEEIQTWKMKCSHLTAVNSTHVQHLDAFLLRDKVDAEKEAREAELHALHEQLDVIRRERDGLREQMRDLQSGLAAPEKDHSAARPVDQAELVLSRVADVDSRMEDTAPPQEDSLSEDMAAVVRGVRDLQERVRRHSECLAFVEERSMDSERKVRQLLEELDPEGVERHFAEVAGLQVQLEDTPPPEEAKSVLQSFGERVRHFGDVSPMASRLLRTPIICSWNSREQSFERSADEGDANKVKADLTASPEGLWSPEQCREYTSDVEQLKKVSEALQLAQDQSSQAKNQIHQHKAELQSYEGELSAIARLLRRYYDQRPHMISQTILDERFQQWMAGRSLEVGDDVGTLALERELRRACGKIDLLQQLLDQEKQKNEALGGQLELATKRLRPVSAPEEKPELVEEAPSPPRNLSVLDRAKLYEPLHRHNSASGSARSLTLPTPVQATSLSAPSPPPFFMSPLEHIPLVDEESPVPSPSSPEAGETLQGGEPETGEQAETAPLLPRTEGKTAVGTERSSSPTSSIHSSAASSTASTSRIPKAAPDTLPGHLAGAIPGSTQPSMSRRLPPGSTPGEPKPCPKALPRQPTPPIRRSSRSHQ